jgi:hypothetical protein
MHVYFKKEMDHPSVKGLMVVFEAVEEDLDFQDHFSEEEDVKWIENQLNYGNMSAWFCAKLTVKLDGTDLEATDYLGGCSYKSFEEFTDTKDYFGDMIDTATNELVSTMREAKEKLESVLKTL